LYEHVFVLSTNEKGAIAETAIAAAATKLGVPVLRPIVEHGRYDLAFEIGQRILRVQCKWGNVDRTSGVIRVNLTSCRHSPVSGYIRSHYSEGEIDAVAVYAGVIDRCYLLVGSYAVGRNAIFLRLSQPKNGQRACINLASDFEFNGAIAQLGERLGGTQKVAGSSPASSTSSAVQVGCHEFRNHFGYYLEQAAAGTDIEVSRRGRPHARLVAARPPEPELALVSSA
jgi:prevent-host-death family protein